MAGYAKVFETMLESTVWCESSDTRVVWITMLAMADRKGVVQASIPGLANRAQVSIAAVRTALDKFKSPDLDSRTPDHEGRRIIAVDGGWQLLNHGKYRNLLGKEERREYQRKWDRENRAAELPLDTSESDTNRQKRHIAEAATATEKTQDLPGEPGQPDGFIEFYAAYPRHEARARAERAWRKLNPDPETRKRIHAAIAWQRQPGGCLSGVFKDGHPQDAPLPASWLNAKRWEDERPKPNGQHAPAPPPDPAVVARQAAVADAQARWADVETDAKLGLLGQRLAEYTPVTRAAIAAIGGVDALVQDSRARQQLAPGFIRAYLAQAPQSAAGGDQ